MQIKLGIALDPPLPTRGRSCLSRALSNMFKRISGLQERLNVHAYNESSRVGHKHAPLNLDQPKAFTVRLIH